MQGSYLGPEFAPQEIEAFLRASEGAVLRDSNASRCSTRGRGSSPTKRSSAGSTAGWSSGRARSARAASWAIRGSPRMQAQMNLKIKFREGFRPFAPAVLRERVSDYFELDATRRTCCSSPRCEKIGGFR